MGLKEFLNLDWRRIILFIILFLFFPAQFIDLISIPENPQPTRFVPLFGGFQTIVLIFANLSGGRVPIFTNLNVMFFIFSLVVSYFLSCLIIWIYEKKIKKR